MGDEPLNAYDVVIADLEQQIEQMTVAVKALRKIRDLGIPAQATASLLEASIANKKTIPHDAFFGMTLADAARKFLNWNGNRMTKSNTELCDALRAGGFPTTATNFAESVRATLARNDDFVRISGQWGMKDWYGDRTPKRKRRIKTGEPEVVWTGDKTAPEEDEDASEES